MSDDPAFSVNFFKHADLFASHSRPKDKGQLVAHTVGSLPTDRTTNKSRSSELLVGGGGRICTIFTNKKKNGW